MYGSSRSPFTPNRPPPSTIPGVAVASPADHLGFALSGVDVGERLPVGVTAAGDLVGAPGHWEAAGHGFHEPAGSGFHLTGVTASGVPLLELTQPDAVRLHGLGSL